MRKILLIAVVILIVAFLLIQLVPYGRNHTNPPVIAEPAWDSPQTRELAQRACFDCHSNETQWPWYSSIAPVSWMVQRHTDAESIYEGEMPLPSFLLTHPEARLSGAEKQALAQGLSLTAGEGENEGGEGESGENESGEHEGRGEREEGEEHEDDD
jgi:hypothetical protein